MGRTRIRKTRRTAFARRLRKIRQLAALTQAALGERLGMTASGVCELEMGQCAPSRQTRMLLELFEKTMDGRGVAR